MILCNKKTLKKCFLLVFVILYGLLPFIEDNSFITDIYYFISFTLSVSMSLLIWRLLHNTTSVLRVTIIDIISMLILVYLIFSASLVSKFPSAHIVYMKLTCVIMLLVISTYIFKSKNNTYVFVLFLVFLGIVYSVCAIQKIDHIIPSQINAFKIQYPFRNPAILAGFLGSILPFSISFILFSNNKMIIKLGYLSSVLILIVLFYSCARSACLSAVIGAGIVFLYKFSLGKFLLQAFKYNRRTLLILSGLSSSAIVTLLYIVCKLKLESVYGRLFIYKITAIGLLDNSFWGSGYDTFPRVYGLLQAKYFAEAERCDLERLLADNTNAAFNEYLQILFETGIIGLLGVLLLIIIVVKKRSLMNTPESIGAMGALGVTLVNACFSYPFHSIPILCLSILFLGIINSRYQSWQIVIPRWALVILIILTSSFFLVNCKAVYDLTKWKSLVKQTEDRNFDSYSKEYSLLSKQLYSNPFFLYNYGVELLLNGNSKEAIFILNSAKNYFIDTDLLCCLGKAYQCQNDFKNAEECFLLASHMVPHKFYPLYCLATLYRDNAFFDKSYNITEKILKNKIKINSYQITVLKEEMQALKDSLSCEK